LVDLTARFTTPLPSPRPAPAAAPPRDWVLFPCPPGHELKRPRRDFLARARHSDNHAGTPSAMTTFERLPHQLHVAYALEREVGAASGEVHQVRNQIAFNLSGIHEVGGAELARNWLPFRIHIDRDDHSGAGEARALDDVEADAPDSEHHHPFARLHPGGVEHRSDTGGDATSDVTNLLERRVLSHLGQRD